MSKSTPVNPGPLPATITQGLNPSRGAAAPPNFLELSPKMALLARVGWVGLVIFTFGVALGGFPYYLQSFKLCADVPINPCFDPSTAQTLQSFGITLNAYNIFWWTMDTLKLLVSLGIAFLIFWRKSNYWIGLVTSYGIINSILFTTFIRPLVYSTDHNIWLDNRHKPGWTFDNWYYAGRFLEYLWLLVIFLIFALFPSGRFVPRWSRWLIGLYVVVRSYYFIVNEVFDWIEWQQLPITIVDWICIIGLLAAVIVRYRLTSTPVERRQIKLIMITGTAWLLAEFILTLPSYFDLDLSHTLYWPLQSLVSTTLSFIIMVSFALGLFRYHLWDFDLVINRTLVYLTLTISVIILYILVVSGLETVFNSQLVNNFGISLSATGFIAIILLPLRTLLQHGVNRLMYGERDDPYSVLARLGKRLEDTLNPERVFGGIVETVAVALKLPYVAIVLAKPGTGHLEPGSLDEQPNLKTINSETADFDTVASYGLPSPTTANLKQLPLSYQGEILGYFEVAPRAGEHLSDADKRLLTDLARPVGVAIYAACLTRDLQISRGQLVTAREEERRRMRRDLHDGLGPSLASLTFKLEAANNLLSPGNERVSALLKDATFQTQQTIVEIRRLVYNLRPPALDDLGLLSALSELVRQQQTQNLTILLEAPEQLPELRAAIEVAVYRIAQEALTNVTRHARATNCKLSLEIEGEILILEVVDNGQGIISGYRAGVGLRAIRERASELGGKSIIGPGISGGTQVKVKLPLTMNGLSAVSAGINPISSNNGPKTHREEATSVET